MSCYHQKSDITNEDLEGNKISQYIHDEIPGYDRFFVNDQSANVTDAVSFIIPLFTNTKFGYTVLLNGTSRTKQQ